jgi:hypothetical protein
MQSSREIGEQRNSINRAVPLLKPLTDLFDFFAANWY